MAFGEYLVILFTKSKTGWWLEKDVKEELIFYKINVMCMFL